MMRRLSQVPLPLRHVVAGVVTLGSLGGVAGLVVGLFVHASTAWFAVLELGVPAAVVGGLLGVVSGCVARGAVALRRPHTG